MQKISEYLRQPVVKFDSRLFYDGFYDAYQYQKQQHIPIYNRLILSSIAFCAVILTVFTMVVFFKSKKIRRTYQFIILEHVVLSTAMCALFPLSGSDMIANYGLLFMDRWTDSHHLPLFIFGMVTFGYMGVLVASFHTFVLNVIWSTNYQFKVLFLKKFPAETVVNGLFIIYEIFGTIAYILGIGSAVLTDSENFVNASIQYDHRLEAIYLEKSVATVIVTNGFVVIVSVAAVGLVLFLAVSAFLSILNYKLINERRNGSSATVQKQQKAIIVMEFLYSAMTIASYIPSCATLIMSVFLNCLPDGSRKLPMFLFLALPLQLLPIFDCLLHIYAIRVHRQTAKRLLMSVIIRKKNLASEAETPKSSSYIPVRSRTVMT